MNKWPTKVRVALLWDGSIYPTDYYKTLVVYDLEKHPERFIRKIQQLSRELKRNNYDGEIVMLPVED